MAAEGGRADSPLVQTLFNEPYRFDFFQAVRLLEWIYENRHPIGHDGIDPAREIVRFRTRASLEFPPSEIYSITRNGVAGADEERTPEMMVAFMGLTGPLGVLPLHYTELLMERARYKDTGLWEFFDIFNHRLISLFYRAWEKYRFPIAYERSGFDSFTEYLFDFVGMGTRGLRRNLLNIPDEGLLLYSGLINQRPHSASAIAAVIGDYFGVTASIRQFTGQWLRLEESDYSRLGKANNELGVNTIAGTRVWDDQSKFRLRVGPLSFDEFRAFVPAGTAFKPLSGILRFMSGLEFDFDAQLVLKKEEVPPARLGAPGADAPLLGWTTWLKTREFLEDDEQVVLQMGS